MLDEEKIVIDSIESRIKSLETEVAALRVVAFHVLSQSGTVTSSRVMACLRGDVLDQRARDNPDLARVVDAVQDLIDQVMEYDAVEG